MKCVLSIKCNKKRRVCEEGGGLEENTDGKHESILTDWFPSLGKRAVGENTTFYLSQNRD